MTPIPVDIPAHQHHAPPPVQLMDDKRGAWGMALFIMTEATLFVMLFFAYYYTKKGCDRWTFTEPPKLHYSIPMLVVLASSSGVIYLGEQAVKTRKYGRAKIALACTIAMGLGFLVLTYFEFKETLEHVTPRTDAYGSTFFTLISLHGIHVVVGLLMLTWVLVLPRWEPARLTPHRPYHNAALYWHFVDTVWVLIVALLYVVPNIYNGL